MMWTPEARRAVEHAQTDTRAEVIDAAIHRAEVLATEAGSTVVDMDLWLHARTVVDRCAVARVG
jgi:hypothetical protein